MKVAVLIQGVQPKMELAKIVRNYSVLYPWIKINWNGWNKPPVLLQASDNIFSRVKKPTNFFPSLPSVLRQQLRASHFWKIIQNIWCGSAPRAEEILSKAPDKCSILLVILHLPTKIDWAMSCSYIIEKISDDKEKYLCRNSTTDLGNAFCLNC